MRSRLKTIFIGYFSSGWKPSVVYAVVLILFMLAALPRWSWTAIIGNILFVFLSVAFLGIFTAATWNLIKKRWAISIANLGLLALCAAVSFSVMGFLMLASMFGPSEDGFADNLTIPTDIEVTEPLNELDAPPGEMKDTFQQSLLSALSTPGNDDPTITADVDALMRLHGAAPEVLKRLLTTSPSWRLFKEHREVFATRRWKIGKTCRYNLHGYYTRHDIDTWSKTDIPDFQSRFTIGFSGKPWARASGDATQMNAGQTRSLTLSTGNEMHESRCIIKAGNLLVEVYEQSEAKERRLTKAALSHVEQELSPLVSQPTWKTICNILPHGSIRKGDPVFNLRNSFQPGIYDSEIWFTLDSGASDRKLMEKFFKIEGWQR